MKILMLIILSFTIIASCSKNNRIDVGGAPNTSAGKDGSDAGAGPTGSLGSENPSTPQTAPTPPAN
jgi:hypothetical protein